MEANKDISLFELQVDHESTIYLRETAKWARFLAILGFVWCGFFAFMGFFVLLRPRAFNVENSTGYIYIFILYIAIAAVYFFPCIYALNFARKMKTALQNNDQGYLNASLKNLKSSFRYLGILAIVGLALLVVVVFFNMFDRFG